MARGGGTDVAAPAPPRPRRAMALAVEHGVDDLYQGVVPALVPLLIAARGYDLTQAGGIVLAATLLSSIAQPLFGVLADRVSVPWLRTAGLLTASLGIAAVGLTTSYVGTWVAVLVSGLGTAAYHPEAARAVHATGTGDRGMGWFTFGGLSGFAAGPPAVGLVLGALGLGATPLLALPAVAVVALTLARALRPAPVPAVPTVAMVPAADGAGGGSATGGDRSPAAAGPEDWRRFGWLTAVVMARSVVYYGISAFLVVDLLQRGASPAVATLALTVFTACGAAAVLLSSRLTDRFGRVPTLAVAYAAAAVLLAAVLAAPSPVLALVAAGLLGAVLNVPVPVHTTLGQAYLPRHLGLASAVTLGLAVSTGGLASPLLGALADDRGITTALAVLVVLPVAAALLVLRLRPRRVPHQQVVHAPGPTRGGGPSPRGPGDR